MVSTKLSKPNSYLLTTAFFWCSRAAPSLGQVAKGLEQVKTASKPHAQTEGQGAWRPPTGSTAKQQFCNMAPYECKEDSLLTADSRRHNFRHESLFVHWADGNVWPLCGFLLAVWTGITLVFVPSSINVSQSCPLNKAKILYSILTARAYHSKWFYT